MKYAIKSKVNGKYLSNLFEDEHSKIFQGQELDSNIYYWNVKEIAEKLAVENNAIVIEVR